MLGLRALFAALSRLTVAVSHSTELFETANAQIERQLGLESETPALAHEAGLDSEEEAKATRRNGRKLT